MAAGSSSARHVVEALEPDVVRRVVASAWQSVLACVAAATQPLAGTVSLGLAAGGDVGAAVHSAVLPCVERLRAPADRRARTSLAELRAAQRRLPPALRGWSQGAVTAATQGAMVFATFRKRQIVLTLSAAALGARLVVCAIKRPLARLFGDLPDAFDEGEPGFAALLTALTAVGFVAQVRPARLFHLGARRVSPLRWPLRPAFACETALKAIAAKNIAAAP